jgi:cyclohexanone monooxygenase
LRGEGGLSLKEKWANGPRMYLGVQTTGFPNFFIATAASFCNVPRCAEMIVEWISDCVNYVREKGFARIEATIKAEKNWTEHATEIAAISFATRPGTPGGSWFIGANIPGKEQAPLLYANTAPKYRKELELAATNGYEGFMLK